MVCTKALRRTPLGDETREDAAQDCAGIALRYVSRVTSTQVNGSHDVGPGAAAWLRELQRPEIHVWIARPETIQDPRLIERYRALLTDAERERGLRFRFERHRHQYWVTRALVRTALSRYLAVPPEAWRFDATEHGRPQISEPAVSSALSFNLSHTDGLIACAVAWGAVIGCDVEDLERRVEAGAIAHRFFAPSERRMLEHSPRELHKLRFLELWTLKEAYLKACGTGLRTPLESFAFELARADGNAAPDRIAIAFDGLDDDASAWRFTLIRVDARHLLALAVRAPEPIPVILRECVPLARES